MREEVKSLTEGNGFDEIVSAMILTGARGSLLKSSTRKEEMVSDITKEMCAFFEHEIPGSRVDTNYDFDLQARTFRVQEDNRLKHVFKVSDEVLEDNSVAKIKQLMDRHDWKNVLDKVGKAAVVLTSDGFRYPARHP